MKATIALLLAALLYTPSLSSQVAPASDARSLTALRAQLEQIRRPLPGDMSIYMKNLSTGDEIALDYDKVFETFSVIKLTIAADPRHLGARIGITAVLHTWGSAMTQQPHSEYLALSSP